MAKKNTLIFTANTVFITLLGYLGIRQVGILGRKLARVISSSLMGHSG